MKKRFLLVIGIVITMTLGMAVAEHAADMVLVEGGTFQMGDEYGDLWSACWPVHTVQLTYDYYIGKYEVTFDEYDAYCEDTGVQKPSDYSEWAGYDIGRGKKPVVNVCWWEAIRYCNWLSEKEGLAKAYDGLGDFMDKDGKYTKDITKVEGYRLPTEAEWEYAARGGHQGTGDTKFAGSNNLNEVGWYWQNSGNTVLEGTDDDWTESAVIINHCEPHVVGQKASNELGIHDMSGNVWEWCHDRYARYIGISRPNPTGPYSSSYRVTRGGTWDDRARLSRIAARSKATPYLNYINLGFRIARTRE